MHPRYIVKVDAGHFCARYKIWDDEQLAECLDYCQRGDWTVVAVEDYKT